MMARPAIAVGVLVLLAAITWGVIEGRETSKWKERAETAETAVGLLVPQRDALADSSATLAALVAVQRNQYVVDSAEWAGERDRQRVRLAAADQGVRDIADRLRAAVEPEIATMVDSLAEAHNESLRAMAAEIDTWQEQASSLQVQVDTLRAALFGKTRENETNLAIIAQLEIAVEGYRRVANPPFIQRIVGAIPEIGLGAAGTALVVLLVLR